MFGSGSGGGARELDLVLFLFTRTDFLRAIQNEGRWFGNTRFLKEEREFRWCENRKSDLWHLFIMP